MPLRIGIRIPGSTNKEETGMHYLESRIQDCLQFSFMGRLETDLKRVLMRPYQTKHNTTKTDDIIDVHFQAITRWAREFFLVVKRGTKPGGNYQLKVNRNWQWTIWINWVSVLLFIMFFTIYSINGECVQACQILIPFFSTHC